MMHTSIQYITKYPPHLFSHSLHHRKTSSAEVRKHGVTRKGEDDGDTVPIAMGPCDHVSTAASSLSATSSASLLSHQTLTLSPDTTAAKTYAKIRQASRARSSGTHQKRK